MDIQEIKEKFKKPIEDPFFNKYFTRPIAYYASWPFIMLRIPAWAVTVSTIIIGVVACFFFTQGSFLTGALLGHLRNIIDHIDGVVARALGTAGPRGKYLDRVAQYVSNPLIFAGIALGVYTSKEYMLPLVAGFSASLGQLWMHYFMAERGNVLHEEGTINKGMSIPVASSQPGFLSALKYFHDKTGFLFRDPALLNVILLAALANQIEMALLFYGIAMPILAFGTLAHEYVAFYR